MMKLNPNNLLFSAVHQNSLVYNTCWEDPCVDRRALKLSRQSRLLAITSAGCNSLDYALAGARVTAVDLNYRQNALLEFKLAAARFLTYRDFFSLFGLGVFPQIAALYNDALRGCLSESARRFWDSHLRSFKGNALYPSFYFSGSSGLFARIINGYINLVPRARAAIDALLHAGNLDEQSYIYESTAKPLFWGKIVRWLVRRNSTLALLGVPPAQRRQVERYYSGGIGAFIEHCIDAVFGRLPLKNNYFWRVYLTGSYSQTCCPEYLKRENFDLLKNEIPDRISITTKSVTEALREASAPFTHLVLLDHMDWLASYNQKSLADEWNAIFAKTERGARIIWRSGGLKVEYVDPLSITVHERPAKVGELLAYDSDLASELHREDRVHTYGSFYIAETLR